MEERQLFRNGVNELLEVSGNVTTTLPELHRVLRVDANGYTVNPVCPMVPEQPDDIYIGRDMSDEDKLNNFKAYKICRLADRITYQIIDMSADTNKQMETLYNYAANMRNLHGIWFRAVLNNYQLANPNWRSNLTHVRNTLRTDIELLVFLGNTLKIPRFEIELQHNDWQLILMG